MHRAVLPFLYKNRKLHYANNEITFSRWLVLGDPSKKGNFSERVARREWVEEGKGTDLVGWSPSSSSPLRLAAYFAGGWWIWNLDLQSIDLWPLFSCLIVGLGIAREGVLMGCIVQTSLFLSPLLCLACCHARKQGEMRGLLILINSVIIINKTRSLILTSHLS
jgi:hypothetical protein